MCLGTSLGRSGGKADCVVAYLVDLPGIKLQLGQCIISVRYWSLETQLEMPADYTCMYTGHTRRTLTTAYSRSRMFLDLMMQVVTTQYTSTGCESGYRYYLDIS